MKTLVRHQDLLVFTKHFYLMTKHRQQDIIVNEENFKWIQKKQNKTNEDETRTLIELLKETESL